MKGKKTGGKIVGSKNKTTTAAKELILRAIDNQSADFDAVMVRLKTSNPTEWARIMVKMFDFVIPKHIDMKTDGQQIQAPIIQLLPPNDKN